MKIRRFIATFALICAVCRFGLAQEPTTAKEGRIIVYVTGEVKKSGQQSLPKGATVLEALASAGGETEDTDLKGAQLLHKRSDGKWDHTRVNLKEILKGNVAATVCEDGDILKIPRRMGPIQF